MTVDSNTFHLAHSPESLRRQAHVPHCAARARAFAGSVEVSSGALCGEEPRSVRLRSGMRDGASSEALDRCSFALSSLPPTCRAAHSSICSPRTFGLHRTPSVDNGLRVPSHICPFSLLRASSSDSWLRHVPSGALIGKGMCRALSPRSATSGFGSPRSARAPNRRCTARGHLGRHQRSRAPSAPEHRGCLQRGPSVKNRLPGRFDHDWRTGSEGGFHARLLTSTLKDKTSLVAGSGNVT